MKAVINSNGPTAAESRAFLEQNMKEMREGFMQTFRILAEVYERDVKALESLTGDDENTVRARAFINEMIDETCAHLKSVCVQYAVFVRLL